MEAAAKGVKEKEGVSEKGLILSLIPTNRR